MDPMAVAISVGLVLDDAERAKRSTRNRSNIAPLLAIAFVIAILLIGLIGLTGCSAQTGHHRPQTAANVRQIYGSPHGGGVYQVDGPEGPKVITIVPGYRSPTGVPGVYRVDSP